MNFNKSTPLHKFSNMDAIDPRGWTALHVAAQEGREQVVEYLVAQGSSLDIQEKQGGKRALCLAAESGHEKIVIHLLAKGANHNIPDNEGNTPLRVARGETIKILEDYIREKGALSEQSRNTLSQ